MEARVAERRAEKLISICSPIIAKDSMFVITPITNPSFCHMAVHMLHIHNEELWHAVSYFTVSDSACSLASLRCIERFFLSSLASVPHGATEMERVGRHVVVEIPRKEDYLRMATPAEDTKADLRVFVIVVQVRVSITG